MTTGIKKTLCFENNQTTCLIIFSLEDVLVDESKLGDVFDIKNLLSLPSFKNIDELALNLYELHKHTFFVVSDRDRTYLDASTYWLYNTLHIFIEMDNIYHDLNNNEQDKFDFIINKVENLRPRRVLVFSDKTSFLTQISDLLFIKQQPLLIQGYLCDRGNYKLFLDKEVRGSLISARCDQLKLIKNRSVKKDLDRKLTRESKKSRENGESDKDILEDTSITEEVDSKEDIVDFERDDFNQFEDDTVLDKEIKSARVLQRRKMRQVVPKKKKFEKPVEGDI